MHKVTIENKIIEITENLSVDEIAKNNFSNIRPVAAKIDGVLVDLSQIVTKDSLIELIKPDVLVKGGDYKGKDIIGKNIAKEVKVVEFINGKSTTKIIERIQKS